MLDRMFGRAGGFSFISQNGARGSYSITNTVFLVLLGATHAFPGKVQGLGLVEPEVTNGWLSKGYAEEVVLVVCR
jgi:hypothetical protein